MRADREALSKMRRAGAVVAEMHSAVREAAAAGVSTSHLDQLAASVLAARRAKSNFLGYGRPPYPAVTCMSVNEVVVHGIPDERVLQEGDLLSVDCGAVVDGYHGDAAFSIAIGRADSATSRLLEVTEAALSDAIGVISVGVRLNEIGRAIQRAVEAAGLHVVDGYCGHGIGTAMHEPPDVLNYWPGRGGPRLAEGMTLAIEPMVAVGTSDTFVAGDGWSVVTTDGSRSAHFEHTVVVTARGAEVLTRR